MKITFFTIYQFLVLRGKAISHFRFSLCGFLVFLLGLINLKPLAAQDFYDLDTIQKIEISFTQSNWDYILDTAKQGNEGYFMSQWVKINGIQFDSAGVKYKGNSSYNPAFNKNPFHIELDHFKDQDYFGYKDIKLSNGYNDPSFLREVLLYTMFSKYAPAPRANFAQVYVNEQYIGIYTNVESVTRTFLEKRYYSKNKAFVYADSGGCNLLYKGNDSSLYNQRYTMKSETGWTDLMLLCDTLSNNIGGIEHYLDVDRTLWWMAYLNAMLILDSYIGRTQHNYYLYQYQDQRFTPILWDLNGGFGTYARPDFGPFYPIAQLQSLNPLHHATDSMWPLVKNLLSIPIYKRVYIAHLKTIMNENISNGNYITFAQHLQSVADTAVFSDPNKFGTYSQFLTNLYSDVTVGTKTVPGIIPMMNSRDTFLSLSTEFMNVAPTISSVQVSDTFPPLHSNMFFTTVVSNATDVYLGVRYSGLERFIRVPMFDDGFHGDGTAADGVYGAAVIANSAIIHYYVYAENISAGIFSPVRAEHEYYSLKVDVSTVQQGDLVINELMAKNSHTVQNDAGAFADWIELYNKSTDTLSLDFLYLSDDVMNLLKWQFPDGLKIPPDDYFIIWADENTGIKEVHCSFKFDGGGESVYLSYPTGEIIDSVVFGQQENDISFARFPNGTGDFTAMLPTFNAKNNLAELEHEEADDNILLFPNPVSGVIHVGSFIPANSVIVVQNTFGELVNCSVRTSASNAWIDVSHLSSGLYLLKIQGDKQVVTRKFVISR